MAKKPNPTTTAEPQSLTEIQRAPEPVAPSAPAREKTLETVLISLGGYNHAAVKTAAGFNLPAAALPSDFSAAPGSVGYILEPVRKRFTVVSAESVSGVLKVTVALEN